MAFNKRTWLGRQGTGLNKFSIGGATPVTIVNQPDSVTQVGDALSAGNLNDLEDRIEDAFDDVDTELDTKANEQDVTNLNNAINQLDHRLENLEQSKGDYIVSSYKDGSVTPSGKGKWCVVEGVEGVSRCENQLVDNPTFDVKGDWTDFLHSSTVTVSNNVLTAVENNSNDRVGFGRYLRTTANHSYLCLIRIDSATSGLTLEGGIRNFLQTISVGFNALVITTNANSTEVGVASSVGISGATVSCSLFNVKDLNVYFGTSDLSFLGATDSAKLATIQTNYPHLLLPTEYGTRIVDWTGNGVRAWARNIWNENWELGDIASSTGTPISNNNYIRSVDFCECVANTTYYLYSGRNINCWVYWYDADKNYIGYTFGGIKNATTTSLSNARYFKISSITTSYADDICLNVSDSLNGTYTPYHAPDTLSFPSTTLKSAGSVRDRLELNVEVSGVAKKRETERVGSGTIAISSIYERASNPNCDYAIFALPSAWIASTAIMIPGVERASNYSWDTVPSANYFIVYDTANKEIAISVSKGTTLAQAQATYDGRVVNYGLATESVTLSDPLIDNTLLTEAYGRLSTVQTGTVVDGISDLGFITL